MIDHHSHHQSAGLKIFKKSTVKKKRKKERICVCIGSKRLFVDEADLQWNCVEEEDLGASSSRFYPGVSAMNPQQSVT